MSGQKYSVTIDVGANISSAKSAAQQLKGIFDNIGLGAGQSSKISNMFSELDKALDEVQRKSATALTSMSEVKGLDKAKDKVTSLINVINSEFTKMGKMGNVDLAKNFGDLTRKINDATKAIRNYNTTISGINKGHIAAKSSASALSQQLAEQAKYYEQLKQIRKEFGKGQKDEDILKALNQKQITAKGLDTRRRNELQAFYDAHGGKESVLTQKGTIRQEWAKNNAQDAQALEKLIQASDQASQAFTQASEKYQNFSNALSNFKGSKAFEELKKNAAEATQALQKFDSGVLNAEAFNKLKAALEQAFPGITAGIQNSATAVDEFKQRIEQISTGKLEEFRKKVPEIDTLLKQLGVSSEEVGKKVTDGMSSFSAMQEADADIEHLTYRLKYFFSLAGGFNLMRRAIRSAVTTTKELDAAMTQTAVVSTYTVSDMWKTLPKYSKEASKLGTAIKDVYNAQTLYVQQGLDMNTAMDLGVETMKMARVAGIGAEEATNSMTAALRGFNMAIDEKSAQRINDVYSKLAQNTASNTQEISTAMTKTAALANSANMSFENTAAFLATIIESTREGAETAGTALKTVIARFTEVKQLYTKNQLMGTDEEGQEIDVNKISKALRTAGINMNEFFTGAKGLDEIFKELGSKWNNLSTVQQRYIATQAAGSRQQSRFLALMQNYERTVELTEMAYNSAGSGQEQFEKTLDSLAAKTEQLKNSWDTLLMGLANSDAIKGIVDFGTDILNVINKIIDALSGSSGLTKALATLSIGMGVFRAGRGAFGKGGLFSYLLGGKEISTRVSKTLVGGIVTSLKTAKTTPELGAALGSTISNSLKRNFQLWGQGPNVGGQYLPKDQLEQLKADAEEYQRITNNINRNIRGAESYRENLEAGKVKLPSGLTKEQALEKNQQEINDFNKQKQQIQENFVKEQKEKGFSDSTIRTAMTDPEQIQKATVNYKALGNAALIAGVGFAALASYMKNTGKASQEAVASVEALSTGLTTMAMTMKLLQSVGSAVGGLSFLTGGWGLAIGAAVGAIVGIVKVVDALTENAEERQKRINESITENQTHIKDLENGYKQVDDSLGSIIEKQDSLNKLTEGTLAWKDAIKELNTEIQTLVQNFPEFLEAVEIGDNGEWIIDTKAVERIQQEKKNKINEKKQLDAALQYNNLLEKINKIQENSPYYNGLQTDAVWTGMSIYTFLDPLLRQGNYSKVSQESINGIIEHFSENEVPSSYEDLIENFKWLEYFISEKEFEHLPVGSFNTFLSGLSYYKQLSGVNQETQTALSSFVTQFLMDQLDEVLPTELYGGTFRKFIYAKAKEKASTFKIDKLNSEDLEFYRTKYNNILEAEDTGKKPTDSEIETYAAIIKLTDEITTEYLEYFKKNKNPFTQGRLTLGEYKNKFDNSTQDDIEYQISKYYIDLFNSFKDLQEELGSDLNFDDTITASTVSQVESIIRDAKNNYGKEAAIEVASFIKNVYDNLSSEGSAKEEDFNKIVSDIESGVIITQEQLARVVGKSFDGDFEAIRRYFTKPKTINNLIESFSDELSFIDSIRKGQQTYTEEERNKLLQAGYKESDFVQTAQGFSIEKLNPTDVAEVYQKSLLNEITEFTNSLTAALDRKEIFDLARETFTSKEDLPDSIKKFFLQDFDSLQEKQIKDILDDFGINKLYNFNTNELVDIKQIDKDALISTYLPWLFESNNSELKGQQDVLNKLFETLSSEENQLTSDTYSKLLSYTQEIRQQRGNERANSLLSQLLSWNNEDIFKDVEGVDKFPEFLDAIGKLDWSNIDNIEDFQKALKDQGIALNNASGELEELFNTFKQIYKLAKVITADEIKQLAQYGLQLKNEIKNKTDAAYTKEQRDYLVNAQKELVDQFVYNTETGGYTYIGNKKVLEQTAQQAAVTTGYEQLQAQKILATEGKGVSPDAYRAALKTVFGVEEPQALSDEQIEALDQFIEQEPYISQQFEAATEVLKYAGLNNDQARMAGASAEVQKATTITDAEKAGLNINELTNYAQQLSQVNTALQDTTGKANELAYAIAYDNMLMNKGISELSSNYSNWGKILEKAAEDEKVKSTADYANAIVGLREALQKITGTTVEFSEEFLTAKENLDLFKKAAKGDTDAINQLRKNAAKNILDVNSLGAAGQQLSNWLDSLNLDKIKIGAELDTKVADVFQGLLDAGIMTADQVNQALETIGYEPDVGTETVTVGSGTQTHQNGYTTFTDVNGVTHTVKNEGGMDIAADQQIEVPVIGGSSKAKAMGSGRGAAKFKGGAGSTFNPPPKSGGGGGKKDFKNDFDKYYNQVEDINELIRQRNLLESDYNQLLKAEGTSGADIYKNLQKQLKLIEERRKLTADLAEKRKQQLFETMQADEYKDVAQYAKWNEEDQTIEIDWDAINKIKDSEIGNLVKEYIKKLEELQGQYDEQMQLLEELQDLEQEILKERGKEAYKSLEDRVRDALIKQIQDKIDELQAVDEAINETNQKLFDSISQTLELQRQERTNAKTEEELSDKEKRLAYLQQDSSNANAVEIAQLQEELADARQDYTDNLIDQKISELQRQNDEAQEQRQQQIELMQQSLDWQEKNGEFWQQVYSLISDGIGPNGSLVTGSKLDTLLKDGEGWQSLSDFEKMDWLNNLENLIAQAVGFLAHNRQLEDLGVKEGTQITFTNKEGKKLTGTVDKNGNVVVDNGNGTTTTYTGVYQDYAGNYHTVEDTPEPDKTGTETPEKPPEKETYKYEKYSSKKHWKIKFVEGKEKEKTKEKHTFKDNVCTKCGYKKKKKSGGSGDDETTTVQGGDNGDTYEEKPGGTHETYIDKDGNTHHIYKDADGKIYYSYVEKAGQNKGTTTGGSGGPGRSGDTSTRNFTSFSPDEVLSSRNSDAFMYLTDVYSNAAKSSLAGAMNSGDNYYDIKVQVDSLGSDYDVDKAIDRIKTRIAQENAYRNVNTLSRLR